MRKPHKKIVTPNARSQKIWYEVVVGERTQVDVAGEYRISQPRVSEIVHRVAEWRAAKRPGSNSHWPQEQQISYANQVTRLKLHKQLGEAEVNYERSQQQAKTVKEKDFIEVETVGETEKEKVVRRTRETTTKHVPQGDFRFLSQQFRLTKELREVAIAEAQLPPPAAEPEPGTMPPLTLAESKRIQRLARHWHNQQLRTEAGRLKTPLYLWPPTKWIDLDWYDRPELDARDAKFYQLENHDGTVKLSAINELTPPPDVASDDERNAFSYPTYNPPKADYDPSFQFPREGEVTTSYRPKSPPVRAQYSEPDDKPDMGAAKPVEPPPSKWNKDNIPSLVYHDP